MVTASRIGTIDETYCGIQQRHDVYELVVTELSEDVKVPERRQRQANVVAFENIEGGGGMACL